MLDKKHGPYAAVRRLIRRGWGRLRYGDPNIWGASEWGKGEWR